MNNEKLAKKIIAYILKGKYKKVDKLLIRNGNNEELFNILLQDTTFRRNYLSEFKIIVDEIPIQKLTTPIQKKLIECSPALIMYASDELKNDRTYVEEFQHNDKLFAPLAPARYLGPEILNDYEYMSSIIEKFPSQYIESYCDGMDYNYLKNEQIKEAIVKTAGEEGYLKALAQSLRFNQDQMKQVKPEELRRLVILAPQYFADVNEWKWLLSKSQQNSNLKLIKTVNKISVLEYENINSPQKLTKKLYELSNVLDDGLTYDAILQQVKQHWKQIQPWIGQYDQCRFNSIHGKGGFYNIYNLLIGIETKKLDDMFMIFINSESRASAFAEGIKNINVTEDNISFLQLACAYKIFNNDAETIELYNNIFLRILEWNNDPYTTFNFINELSNIHNLHELISNRDIDSIDQELLLNIFGYVMSNMNSIYKINNLEELRDFQNFIDTHINLKPTKSIEDYKNSILLKYFQIALFNAKNIVHSYFESKNGSSLYTDMPEVQMLKSVLERVINANNIKDLDDIAKSLENQKSKISFKDVYQTLNNVKQTYGEKINSSLLNVSKNNGIFDATNINFNLLVHVIGAYGYAPPGDIYDSWYTKENNSSSICTSFISDDNMGLAPTNEHSVVLGFNNLPSNFLELMSCDDLFSKGFTAYRASKFLNPDELKDNTRHGHNEIVIRRSKGKYVEEKIDPSYIVCFDNINDESKVAAEKFGVPIIYIDREKVAERHHNEIVNMIGQFKTTLDPNLLSKIICNQENNKAGLRLTRPDLVEKYFGTEFRQKNIDMLYSVIDNGLKNNDTNAITAMNEFIKVIELEADKFKITEETPHRKNTYDIKYKKYISTLKSNIAYENNFETSPELSPRELYEKFIQCRDKLTVNERAELQYINNNEKLIEQSISLRKVS